jgi:hypothetical protein
MPQLKPWQNDGRDDRGNSPPTPTGSLLDVATHPADSRGYQPINGANAAKSLHEALLQADTVVRSAADTLTFGWADNAEAAAEALAQGGFK